MGVSKFSVTTEEYSKYSKKNINEKNKDG